MAAPLKMSAENLCIGYRQGDEITEVVKNMNFELSAGDFVCLLGPNGVGKSTFIRTLAGMQAPLAGELRIGKTALQSITPRRRARAISVVLTETLPAGMMDAYALVSLGRHPYSGWFGGLNIDDHARIEWALNAVDAAPLAKRQVAELSDGERQKVSIARALAQESRVMLLDEPTAFLDLARRVELMTILRDLAHRENLALLLSTHDLDLALRFADRLWLMSPDGRLVQGAPEALVLNGDLAGAFASERLDWDVSSGHFRTHPTLCLDAHLEGDGIEMVWTRRALERLGFGRTNDTQAAAFTVKIVSGKWYVERFGLGQTFNEIDSLIEWIRSVDWSDTD
jgi:iron complex transport system ATP-binding protein